MADRINWNMLSGPNPIDHALQGFQDGRRDRLQQERQTATLAQQGREEERAVAAEKREVAAHTFEMEEGARKRKLATDTMRIDGLASAAQDLVTSMPDATPEQYKAAAVQSAANLAKYGIAPEEIAAMPVEHFTKQALLGTVRTAMGWKAQVDQMNAERDATLDRDKFTETVRHNKATETNGATNAEANTIRAKKPTGGRARSGGGLLPPPPGGWSRAGG